MKEEKVLNFNKALIDAIAKGAARATRKPVTALRRDVADLKRQIAELKRTVRGLQKGKSVDGVDAQVAEAEAEKAAPNIRVTGASVKKLRAKRGLSQTEFAKLAGVSALTVSKWERKEGRIALQKRTQDALVRLRNMGKKEMKAVLGK